MEAGIDWTGFGYAVIITVTPIIAIGLLLLCLGGLRSLHKRFFFTDRQYFLSASNVPYAVSNYQATGREHRMLDRRTLRNFLNFSNLGLIWLVAQLVSTAVALGIYITSTYVTGGTPTWIVTLDGVVTIFFTADYILQLYTAPNRFRYAFSFFGLVDLIVIIPFYASLFLGDFTTGPSNVLQTLRILRALRILKAVSLTRIARTEVQHRIIVVSLTVFTLLFLTASVVNVVEGFPFHEALYFTIVSFTTVGYGDLTPETVEGRMVMMVFILFGFFLVSYQTFTLASAISSRSKYSVAYHPHGRKHVVLIGDISFKVMEDFFKAFFHEDSYQQHQIVVLSPQDPSFEIKQLLKDVFYVSNVKYLKGSVLVKTDMERAKIREASACFLFTHHRNFTSHKADSETILQCYSVRAHSPKVRLFVHLLLKENEEYLQSLQGVDVLCVEEMIGTSLIRNSFCSGFSTWLTNLIRSYSSLNKKLEGWEWDYYYGCTSEFFSLLLPAPLHGKSFKDASWIVYSETGVVLFGVQNESGIQLNPSSLIITPTTVAFVAARSKRQLKGINTLLLERRKARHKDGQEMKKIEHHDAEPYNLKELGNLQDSILTQVKFKHHIIVAGPISFVSRIILPLRSKQLCTIRKVVILTQQLPSEAVWERLGRLPEVYIVLGSLDRLKEEGSVLGLARASKVVLVVDRASGHEDFFLDAPTIMAFHSLKLKYPHLDIISEIAHESNIPSLGGKSRSNFHLDRRSKWYFAGSKAPLLPSYHFDPYFCSGNVFVDSLPISLMAQAFYKPFLVKLVETIVNPTQNDSLFLMELPDGFKEGSQTVEALYHFLLQKGMITMGLYVMPSDSHNYVFTNPPPDALVVANSKVFVFASSEPEPD